MSKHVLLPFAITKPARRALLRNSHSDIYHSNRRLREHLGSFSFPASVFANIASYATRYLMRLGTIGHNNVTLTRNVTRNVASNRLYTSNVRYELIRILGGTPNVTFIPKPCYSAHVSFT